MNTVSKMFPLALVSPFCPPPSPLLQILYQADDFAESQDAYADADAGGGGGDGAADAGNAAVQEEEVRARPPPPLRYDVPPAVERL